LIYGLDLLKIIGYPNVGKSSLINSLKRSKAVGVGSVPGFTKVVQEVQLDSKVKLLDSPGIVLSNDPEESKESVLALRNSVRIEKLEDPVGAVHLLVSKLPQESLTNAYDVPRFNNPDEFLMQVAYKKGKLGKGGIVDFNAAAIAVLRDLHSGTIPYFCLPPLVNPRARRSEEEDAPSAVRIVENQDVEMED
jgi:nuclear GTP-binding protein